LLGAWCVRSAGVGYGKSVCGGRDSVWPGAAICDEGQRETNHHLNLTSESQKSIAADASICLTMAFLREMDTGSLESASNKNPQP
jgi:hypothetical protein